VQVFGKKIMKKFCWGNVADNIGCTFKCIYLLCTKDDTIVTLKSAMFKQAFKNLTDIQIQTMLKVVAE
jgi:hypothetical protein